MENTSNKKITAQDVVKAMGYILLFVSVILALSRIDTYLRLRAFDDCGKLSRYESTEKNARYSYPVLDIYKNCLADKGIKK